MGLRSSFLFFFASIIVMWAALSFSVVATVFVGCGGCVVYVNLFLLCLFRKLIRLLFFVIFLGFLGVVDVIHLGVVVSVCVGRGCG